MQLLAVRFYVRLCRRILGAGGGRARAESVSGLDLVWESGSLHDMTGHLKVCYVNPETIVENY